MRWWVLGVVLLHLSEPENVMTDRLVGSAVSVALHLVCLSSTKLN